MTQLNFTKMHGLGNDFIVVRGGVLPAPAEIAALADRHTGIGFDQLLWLENPHDTETDIFYRIFNADGGEVEQCGNGARCIAAYLAQSAPASDSARTWKLGYGGGVLEAQIRDDGNVAVTMGEPAFTPASLPFVAEETAESYVIDAGDHMVEIAIASMGNPHAVIRVDSVDEAPVNIIGGALEHHERFPNRANIGFMQIVARDRIRLRVFERGVGETSACGTGACAAVVIGQRSGDLAEEVAVELPGGELRVRWSGLGKPVWLIGEAVTVFEGVVEI